MTNPKHVSGTIKALEWHDGRWDCHRTVDGLYFVKKEEEAGGQYFVACASQPLRNEGGTVIWHATLEAAQAAAQADCEARILAAIQPDPEPVAWPTQRDMPSLYGYVPTITTGSTAISAPEIAHVSDEACNRVMRELTIGNTDGHSPSSAGTVSVEAAARVLLESLEADATDPAEVKIWHDAWTAMADEKGYAWNKMRAGLRALAGERG